MSIINQLKDENGEYSLKLSCTVEVEREIKDKLFNLSQMFKPYLTVDNITL